MACVGPTLSPARFTEFNKVPFMKGIVMKTEDASRLLDDALRYTVENSDTFAEAIEQIQQGGFSLEGITFYLIVAPVEAGPVQEGQSDAKFLRDMRIEPNLTPGITRATGPRRRRRKFLGWPIRRSGA